MTRTQFKRLSGITRSRTALKFVSLADEALMRSLHGARRGRLALRAELLSQPVPAQWSPSAWRRHVLQTTSTVYWRI